MLPFSNAFNIGTGQSPPAYHSGHDTFLVGTGTGGSNTIWEGPGGDLGAYTAFSGTISNVGSNNVSALLYDPAGGLMWAAVSNGTLQSLYHSSSGATWGSPLATSLSGTSCTAAAFAGSVILGGADGLQYTRNNGSTWTSVSATNAGWSFGADDRGVFWAVPAVSSSWHYFTSTDGINWSTDQFGALGLAAGDIPVSVAGGTVIVRTSGNLTYCVRPNARLGVTGTGFTALGPSLSTANKIMAAVSAGAAEVCAIRSDGYLITSVDQGRTWRRSSSQLYSGSTYTLAAGRGRVAASSGALLMVSQGGSSDAL